MWWFTKRPVTSFERPLAEALEPRILYSADLTGGVLPAGLPPTSAEQRTLDDDGEFADSAAAASATEAPATQVTSTQGSVPLSFEINQGQASADIELLARGNGYAVALSGGNAALLLGSGEQARLLEMKLAGADANALATPENLLAGRSNYLLGSDPANWHTDIAHYGSVTYRDVYEGIDLKYYGNSQHLEYDFLVRAGGDVHAIALHFDGAEAVSIDGDGNLVLTLDAAAGRSIRFLAPVSYQEGPNGREAVASRYAIDTDGTVRFEVGDYDHGRALVIDPVLAYGSYLGTSAAEAANAVTVDAAGNVYLVGYGVSGFLGLGGDDVMVSKFSPDLSTNIYTTYYGGFSDERATAIAVDAAGAAYVTGWTKSGGLGAIPTTAGAFQTSLSGAQDAFVFKLNAAGSAVIYSSYLGGSGPGDVGNGIAIDATGNAYVVGTTNSANFPTTVGAADRTANGPDAFVAKFNTAGTALVYSTFVGGTAPEQGNAIAVDAAGQAVIVGTTGSNNLTMVGASQGTIAGQDDAFVVRLNAAGSAINFSTYFGGGKNDIANTVALRTDGTIVIGGVTGSNDLPLSAGALQTSRSGGGDSGFVAIINPATAALTYSTYLGGRGGNETVTGVVVDGSGRVYAVGYSGANNFVTTADALDSTYGGSVDAFVTLIDPTISGAAGLVYSSYLGGAGTDHARGAAFHNGTLYVAGDTTSSSGLAAASGADTTYAGGTDAFVAGFTGLDGQNNAPVLTGANNLAAILEDAVANGGTLVSSLIAGRVNDADVGGALGIAVTAVNNTNGTWEYSTNGGTTWTAFGTPSAGVARLLAANASTYVRFVPNANFNGTVTAGLTFRAWDQTAGTAGGTADVSTNGNATAFSAATASSSITVTAVNDAPVGTSKTVTVAEDGTYTFTLADFGFTDPTDTPANTLLNVRITTLPASGSLTLSGVAVAAAQFVSATDITAGNLKFTPAANANGAGYAAFTFQVQDNGGTANGGVDLDQTARTITINVTAVNDAPVLSGANNLTAIAEDAGANAGTLVSVLIAGKVTDVDAGALAGIAVTAAVNTNGTWQYSTNGGGAWTAFGTPAAGAARLLAADANTYVRFVPNANWNGTVTNGLTFRAWDQSSGTAGGVANTAANGGTTAFSAATASSSITVNSVNDAPAGANNTVTVAEDGAYTFSAADFGFTDAGDTPANTLLAVKITTVPAAGSLTLAGVAVTAGQFISVASINAGDLKFAPAANANGAGYASFTFQVQDNSGTAGGGVDTDPTPRTMTVNVSAVNDSPAVSLPAAQNTASNSPKVFSVAGGNAIVVSDIDAGGGALQVTLSVGAGTLTLSGISGLTFTVGNGTANTTMTFTGTVAAIDAALDGLRFDPTPGYSGSTSLTVSVNDQGNTGSGGPLVTGGAVAINVSFVNSAPVLADSNDLSPRLEDAAADGGTLVSALLAGNVTDVDPGALQGIAVTAVDDTHGKWQYSLNGGATWLDLGPVSATSARLLAADAFTYVRFQAAPHWNGPVADGLTFRAWDRTAGAAGDAADTSVNGGSSAFSAATARASVDVTSVNDAPAGASQTITVLEGGAYAFSLADFGFTDSADSPANLLAGVRIASVPGAGTLTSNGVAVIAGQVVTAADIAAGKLVFTPAANASGADYASFGFQVKDDGGTANGGVDLDPVARTMTVDVTAVSDAPVGANRTVTMLEGATYMFTTGDFSFTDPGDATANNLLNVKIATLPPAGQLLLDGAAVLAGQSVSAADIAAGKLVFVPAVNANGAAYATFSFQVQDDGGTANGGADLDPVARTMRMDVTAVNDAPSGADKTVTLLEDGSYTLTIADFGFTDAVDTPANTLLNVRITTIPASGALTLNGAAVAAGQFISAADIAANRLVFTPAPDANGAGYAALRFQVQDNGGTANGGIDLDPVDRLFSFDVTAVNDAPTGADRTVTVAEDTPHVVTVADFGFSDVRDGGANSLLNVRITTLPAAGSLRLNGAAVAAGQFVSAADIAAGKLVFSPAADANGTAYASFTFRLEDDGGTANGASALEASAHALTVNVTPVNDAPAGQDTTVSTPEDAAYVFSEADFGFADPVDTPANALAGVKFSVLPGAGTLTLNGVALVAGQVVSAGDIAAGKLAFVPAANAHGAGYGVFRFQLRDDGGSANGGVDLDPTANTMTIDVDAVNDAPVSADRTLVVPPGSTHVLTAADFGYADPADAAAPDALAGIQVVSVPSNGGLKLNGVAVTAGQFVAAADIAAGRLEYAASPGNGALTFRVQDSGGTARGGADTEAGTHTLTFANGAAPPAPPPPVFLVPDPGPVTAPPATPLPTTAATATPAGASTALATTSAIDEMSVAAPSGPSLLNTDPVLGGELTTLTGIRLDVLGETRIAGAALLDRRETFIAGATDLLDSLMQTLGTTSSASPALYDQLLASMRSQGFIEELDKLREESRDEFSLDNIFAVSATGVTFGISVVFVLWVIRSGVLLGSLLSAMPAWRVLDPLPVLARAERESAAEEEPDDDYQRFEDPAAAADPARVLRES